MVREGRDKNIGPEPKRAVNGVSRDQIWNSGSIRDERHLGLRRRSGTVKRMLISHSSHAAGER
jgi:hypothetical protein